MELPDNLDIDNPEFQDALKLIQYTNSSVYLTGRAGTGKSTFLKYICHHTPKKYIVLAPTGIAAINAGGVTMHSFFKIPFRPILPNDPDLSTKNRRVYDFLKYNKAKIDLIRETELIIIDEISMVRADILDFVDQVLRVFSTNKTEPFGGKQLLMVGDAFQLEPVVKRDEWDILRRFYKTPYFFSAQVFRQINLIQIELKKVYRQKDDNFVNILDNIRVNSATSSHLQSINNRFVPNFDMPIDELFITLATRRDTVDYINDGKLAQLEGEEFIFTGKVEGEFPESSLPTLLELVLKESAQVMFVKNDIEKRWYNGSLGRIEDFDDNGIYVQLENGDIHHVTTEKWQNLRYKFDEKENKIIAEEIGSFHQFPLRLAWAVTVHKSQGLTFDNVLIDFSGGAFAGGQLYVALSRCRSLEGMYLKSPIRRSDIIVNREVVAFSKYANDKVLITRELQKAKADDEYKKSLVAFRNQRWKDAIMHFAQAIEYRNELSNRVFQRFIAKEFLSFNHYQNRITQLEDEIVGIRKDLEEFAREYFLLANACEVEYNDFTAAIANLNKAIKMNPNFEEALWRRANLLYKTGDINAAEKDCNKLLKLKNKNFDALLLRGKIRFDLNKLEASFQDLLEAKNIKGSESEVYHILHKVCQKMGEYDKAQEYKNIAEALDDLDERMDF